MTDIIETQSVHNNSTSFQEVQVNFHRRSNQGSGMRVPMALTSSNGGPLPTSYMMSTANLSASQQSQVGRVTKASMKDVQTLLDTVAAACRSAAEEEEHNKAAAASLTSKPISQSGGVTLPPGPSAAPLPQTTNPLNEAQSSSTTNNAFSASSVGRAALTAVRSPQDSPRTAASVTSSTSNVNSKNLATLERQKLAVAVQSLLEAVLSDAPRDTVVDYKAIASESTQALDLLLKMLKADLNIAKGLHFIPSELLEPKVQVLRNLLDETTKKFGLTLATSMSNSNNNILTMSTHEGDAVAMPAITIGLGSSASGRREQRRTSGPHPQGKGFAFRANEASATDSTSFLATTAAPLPIIDPSETYDARVLFGNGRWRETEAEDQNLLLRGTITSLTRERLELESELAGVEKQMQQLRERLSRESDKALRAQQQIEVDLRNLAQQLGMQASVSDQPVLIDFPNPIAAPGSTVNGVAPPSTVNEGRQRSASADFNAPANATTPQRTISSASPTRSTASPGGNGGANISNRYQKIESLYYQQYEGRGMELIWNVIDTVYRCEYEAPAIASSPEKAVLSQTQSTGSATGSPEAAPSSPVRMPNYHDPYKSFHDLFQSFIVVPLSTEQSFNTAVRNITPLRSDYVANCLANRVKANSGVVRLLSLETNDARVVDLNLDGNYIGDNGLTPLLPLLARMHNLTAIHLAHNGLRNDGAISLCKAVMAHPSIASIDLSHNTISRTGGKQLLSMVGTTPRVTFVGLEGTVMDAALKGKIEAAAHANLKSKEAGSHQ